MLRPHLSLKQFNILYWQFKHGLAGGVDPFQTKVVRLDYGTPAQEKIAIEVTFSLRARRLLKRDRDITKAVTQTEKDLLFEVLSRCGVTLEDEEG